MDHGLLRLKDSLALAHDCLHSFAGVLALSIPEDPLRLNLPPLLTAGPQGELGSEELKVMATLYLQAELEQAGVIPVAELLAQQRILLGVRSISSAAKLETFAVRNHHWYDRQNRILLFARLFGLGLAARSEEGNTVNRDFQQRFATLCLTLVRYGEDFRGSLRPASTREALLRQVATDLALNLGARQFGNTISAARLIQEQLQQAIDLLNDVEIGVLFQARGLWDVLRKLLGPETPDLGRLLTRGQSGQRILNWLASTVGRLDGTVAGPLLTANEPVYVWAASWLSATGVDLGGAAVQRAA
jgi:hypothetical protein